MNKANLVIAAAGAVALCAAYFFGREFFGKRESRFRDDLWAERKRAEAEKKRIAVEDQVDRHILVEHRPDPRDPPEPAPTASKPPYRLPNFRGSASDVLGIDLTADADTVNKAYKYWIKRYHPDRVAHLGAKTVEQARRRAEQLNAARQELLRKLAHK